MTTNTLRQSKADVQSPNSLTFSEFKEKLASWQAALRSPDDLLVLPSLIEDLLSTCPASGQGVHLWFPKATYVLTRWPFQLAPQQIHDLLDRAALAKGRKPKPHEIADAISFVLNSRHDFASVRRKPLAVLNPARERQARQYRRKAQEELYSRSPSAEPWMLSTHDVLLRRFPANTRLCINVIRERSNICQLSFLAGRKAPQWMVPNIPIAKPDRQHLRAITNFDKWSYQITEFDSGSLDDQASKILWLADNHLSLPLVMVVWSGEKSLHAWWNLRGISNTRRKRFFDLAISIGADPAHATINQLTRTPNALRNGQRQSVVYLI